MPVDDIKSIKWDFLYHLWKAACKKTGENIKMSPGLRHSSTSQLINESGLSVDQAQMVLGHKNHETTERYAVTELATRKLLMESRLARFRTKKEKTTT